MQINCLKQWFQFVHKVSNVNGNISNAAVSLIDRSKNICIGYCARLQDNRNKM